MSAPSSESGEGASGDRRTLALVLAGALAAHLVAGALTPLTFDEAYYRLWSFRPAFGYYDHPPMIAWLIWVGRHVAGDTPLGVRLGAILATTLTSLLTFDLGRLAGLGERVAARGAVWLNATLLVGAGGALAVPDVPNCLFWTAALCCAFRGVGGPRPWWLGAGLMAGLACLSKYSAFFLAPGVLLWLATTRDGRKTLATPWPWLAALIAAAVFAPNLAWNAAHGWITFDKQLFGRAKIESWAPGYFIKFVIDQALLLNPLIALFLGVALGRRSPAALLLICAPFGLYLAFHSLHGEVQGQWPAPLYPLLVLSAATAAKNATGWWRWVRTAAAQLGLGASAAALAFVAVPLPERLPFRDPARDLRNWPAFGQMVEATRLQAGATWVGGSDYAITAELASLGAVPAPVTEVFERDRFTFETPAERADFSKPGLVILAPRDGGEPAIRRCFAELTPLPEIDRGTGHSRVRYRLFRAAGALRDVERDGCGDPGPQLPP